MLIFFFKEGEIQTKPRIRRQESDCQMNMLECRTNDDCKIGFCKFRIECDNRYDLCIVKPDVIPIKTNGDHTTNSTLNLQEFAKDRRFVVLP